MNFVITEYQLKHCFLKKITWDDPKMTKGFIET